MGVNYLSRSFGKRRGVLYMNFFIYFCTIFRPLFTEAARGTLMIKFLKQYTISEEYSPILQAQLTQTLSVIGQFMDFDMKQFLFFSFKHFQMQKIQDKHLTFLNWFQQNGGKFRDIKFPTIFPPTDYIGLSASTNIQRNTVIMAIPKHLIIGIELVQRSQIGFILPEYDVFKGEDNDDKDFNILTLFLILEKMKGKDSFFFPYLQCIDIAETLIHWSDEEINNIKDPFLNINFINEIRSDFGPAFAVFQQIITKNRHLFRQQLTRQLFDQCYGMVMTRCFGWGLPQTMMVPFADFLNHHSNGVHHYVYSQTLQAASNQDYIKKSKQLNLQIFGIDNKKILPINYQKDDRQNYIERNQPILLQKGITLSKDIRSITNQQFTAYFNIIRKQKIIRNYNSQIYPSSDEEDNDTNSEDDDQFLAEENGWDLEIVRYVREKKFFQKMFQLIDKKNQEHFNQPKPEINKQFQNGVTFKWWYEHDDPYFIVATSKNIDRGQQIFNSYGRRNNRFLILWYGFAFQKNKYDSVPFRIWSQRIQQLSGQFLFTRFITELDCKNQIAVGNGRYPYTYLSSEFRLKLTEMNYHLIIFLRFRVIRGDANFHKLKSRYSQLYKILSLEIQIKVLQFYLLILRQLIKRYNLDQDRHLTNMKPYRRYFTSILVDSNTAIVQAHIRGVCGVLPLLRQLQQIDSKASADIVMKYYQSLWSQQQSDEQTKVNNRIFVRYYFKMIHNFISE